LNFLMNALVDIEKATRACIASGPPMLAESLFPSQI
jgi:hypothetical protein